MEIKLPELGDGIESGDVLEVLVAEGDTIQKDQGIVELETDKATVEVPSSHAGRVTKVHVKEGQSVPIGGVLISLETSDASSDDKPAAAPASEASESKKSESKKSDSQTGDPKKDRSKEPATTAPQATQPDQPAVEPPAELPPDPPATPSPARPATEAATATSSAVDDDVIPAGPAVRRFAREVGVDLQRVHGSGPSGRITREDVLAVVRHANQAVQSNTASSPAAEVKSDSTPAESDAWGPVRIEKLSKIRKTIAQRMHQSWTDVPRVTNFDDADVTELEKIRKASKADYAERGIKLTSLPFVIKSVATALRDHPAVNASIDMEQQQVIYKKYVSVGIAVDTERGLIVPALRNADQLSIPEIARELAILAENARSNSFSLDDLRGSSFTISNLGAVGGTYSTPIINVPEVAILLVGRTRKLPMVVDDEIAIRLMMPLSLSYDHRLVDGATAARFMNDVIGYLRAPSRLLLAP